MLIKQTMAALAAVALLAGGAFAQGVLTVSKNLNPDADNGMFNTIQAAVNAAKPGQIIQIDDTETYEEQVTIDGRDVSPWDKYKGGPEVKGGKNGITIRSKNPTSLVKPVIKWQDTKNQFPKNAGEAKTDGELEGNAGNFETCGALRIIRAQGVTIEGIIVDGGGAAPFAWPSVWNGMDDLAHGNAAITLVVAGGAVIRNCELRNAYIGLNVKDRNTGGVFGNPNPADNDNTIPLSGFGKVGNHLIEYNRINGNSLGIFFESAWDLGSTVRYNLVYNNFHTPAVLAWIDKVKGGLGTEANNLQACGAIMFKDMVYTPVAIYNNTFYNNKVNLIGHWKIGATHLLFNNIFGKSTLPVTANGGDRTNFGNVGFMAMDMAFTYRQHNSVTSAYLEIAPQGQKVYFSDNCNPKEYDTLWIRDVAIWNQYPDAEKTSQNLFAPGCPTAHPENMVIPGALLSGGTTGFPRNANMRWLEMSKVSITSPQIVGKSLVLPDLFQSTDPTNAKFLWPDWEHPLVKEFIQNKGWEAAGIRNADGRIADIGAISSNNNVRQPTVVRIKPSNVVLISGGQATASFYLTQESGVMNNPKIKLFRWVAPLPGAGNFGGSAAPKVAETSIREITPPAGTTLKLNGSNIFTFPLTGTIPEYGFFELVIEGTDKDGNTVTSDVGFLPYRELEYFLTIEVFSPTDVGMTKKLTEVRAGEPYKVRVSPVKGKTPYTVSALNEVEYQLFSDPTAQMWRQIDPEPGNPLVTDRDVGKPSTVYENIYFTRAGEEIILGSGVHEIDKDTRLVFLGSEPITVLPGTPDRVAFTSPIPKSQISSLAPIIPRGSPTEVLVEVQDRFGNKVSSPAEVRISSTDTNVGDVGAPNSISVKTVTTDAGVARFIAQTGSTVETGKTFDMIAELVDRSSAKKDTATFRVGRSQDKLEVFYGDNEDRPEYKEYYDPDSTINGIVGQWRQVWVKAVGPDAVIATKNGCVGVEPDYGLKLSSTADVKTPATTFTMSNGVATFWVSAESEFEGCITVSMLAAGCGDRDYSIGDGNRCNIKFTKPSTNVVKAVVFGDGKGVPDTVLITYARDESDGGASLHGGLAFPDSVSLRWPSSGAGDPPPIMVNRDKMAIVDSFTLRVDFRGEGFLPAYTDIAGNGIGLVTIWTGGLNDYGFEVLDGVGPVIADESDPYKGSRSPMLVENLDQGTVPDTIILQISEQIDDEGALEGASILYVADGLENDPASGGEPLSVQTAFWDVSAGGYKLVLTLGSKRPDVGGWIRFNSASGITDIASSSTAAQRHNHPNSGVHLNNRWVKLTEKQIPPEIVSAWYTAQDSTGLLDYAYLTFNKEVLLASWFNGGYFRFGSGADSAVVGENPQRFLSLVDERTVRVDLAVAYPGSQNRITTSGGLSVTVGFNAAREWAPIPRPLTDGAKPVLADTVYLKIGAMKDDGTGFDPDTLVVTYSEALSDQSLTIASPVIIKTISESVPPVLGNPVVSSVTGTSFSRVSYVIEPGRLNDDNFPVTGDLVYINFDAGVSDRIAEANVQDNAFNRRVPLKVERGPLKWNVIVKNNPFKGGPGSGAAVVLTPSAKGAKIDIKARVRLYDNLGNLVIDTPVESPDLVSWSWAGYNGNGRMVGTGTYLFKAVCDATVYGADLTTVDKKERYIVTRPIGFVRGKP